jgi:hypothetical protein
VHDNQVVQCLPAILADDPRHRAVLKIEGGVFQGAAVVWEEVPEEQSVESHHRSLQDSNMKNKQSARHDMQELHAAQRADM